MDKYSYLSNADVNFIDDLYKQYQQDPVSIDITWQKFFEGFDFGLAKYDSGGSDNGEVAEIAHNEVRVEYLIQAYRSRGHLRSHTNPVRERKDRKAILDLEDFGLTEADLEHVFDVGKAISFPYPNTIRRKIP